MLYSQYVSALLLLPLTARAIFPQRPLMLDDDDPKPKPPGARQPVPSLYSQRYSEQTFIGTHDSAAIRTEDNNWSLSGNQYFNVSQQLIAGVRLLQAQGHRDPNGSDEIRLCHFNCALMDGGSLLDHLSTVKAFLDDNPNEVVTLLFVNAGVPLEHWAKAYYDTGLDLISYSPPPWKRYGNMRVKDWPTIASMVATNKRLVTFLSSGANENLAPYLLWEWNYIFETDFGIEAPDQYKCAPARPRWPDGYPNASFAGTTNAAGFHIGELGEHATRCRTMYARRPNFLLVDFFNEGDVFGVEYGMNAY